MSYVQEVCALWFICISPVPGHMGYRQVLLVVGYYEKQCCEYLCICAQVPRDTAPVLMDHTHVTEEVCIVWRGDC